MAQIYISIPIVDQLVEIVITNSQEDSVKAVAASILGYYFPPHSDFFVGPVLQVRRLTSNRKIIDHTLTTAKKATDPVESSLDCLVEALQSANTESGRCWALLFRGAELRFYEFHKDFPVNHQLVQWAEAGDPTDTAHHIRRDAPAIDRMLRFMAQTNEPLARQFQG